MLAAVARGKHRLAEARPWILDDPFALILVGPIWQELSDRMASLFSAHLDRKANAGIVVRSRFAEDHLERGWFGQYVMLGAGLDSFVWRRPDLLGTLRVFEVDHPASQGWKRQRVSELGLPTDEDHVLVAVDFEVASLREGLDGGGFDWDRPTMFSWLGVTPYLTVDAIEETLGMVAACAPGSAVVFTFAPSESLLDDDDRETLTILRGLTAGSGEPLRSFFTPEEVGALVARCGLEAADHADRNDLIRRYFADRNDGLEPWGIEHLVAAIVS